MKKIDACGLSCPEPVLKLKEAMSSGEKEYELLVDNHASKENTTRFGEKMGYTVSVKDNNGVYALTFKK